MRRFLSSSAATIFLLASAARADSVPDETEITRVLALSDDVAYGEYLAGECVTCHDTEAAGGVDDDVVPIIHGRAAAYLVRALIEYRAEVRENTTMQNVAGALGDEEIAALAHYLAAQER